MRRKYFGLAIAAFATLGPLQAWGGDREIAQQIIQRLKANRDSGALKDFTLDMKVDGGVVLFKGSVSQEAQKDLVLQAAAGIEGIAGVVDEVTVLKKQVAETANQPAQVAKTDKQDDASMRSALVKEAAAVRTPTTVQPAQPIVPGQIVPTAAVEPTDDAQVVAAVVSALSKAKDAGQLKGFGVDVKSRNGVLQLTGRASSPAQRAVILRIAESVPGVAGVREAIAVPTAAPSLPPLPEPPSLAAVQSHGGVPAQFASAPSTHVPAMTAPYQSHGAPVAAMPVGMQAAGGPMPMAPHSPVGAPRYDSPNLPNYAWPGYAAYPNYAALTYPQQYSPSAWPYIGPFYPYPQVPLGWRKVTLEWDDGWWMLDFTDR